MNDWGGGSQGNGHKLNEQSARKDRPVEESQ